MNLASSPRPFWHSRRGLLEHLGCLWGVSWGLLGISWGPGGLLGPSWGYLGTSRGLPGASWDNIGGDRSNKRG
eukprot:267986-Pyramimonas_sp.AAC.1